MRATSLLPLVIALAIAGTWLVSQYRSISRLEQESAILQKAIAARASGSLADSSAKRLTAANKAAKDKQPLDWKKIAAEMVEMYSEGSIGDMRSFMKLQQRVETMNQQELVAALDEIAALDLPKESRELLEQMLIGQLSQKDPELALTKFIDRIEDFYGQLGNTMGKWAKKDPTSAIAWFDQQIAAGKFDSKSLDGKSRSRIQFEGNLINILLSSDPDAAGRRLAALPQDQRGEVFQQSGQLKAEDQAAFAKLVRSQVSQEEQTNILAQEASSLMQNANYSKVSEFLDRIQATPTERSACVEEAAVSEIRHSAYKKKITRKDLDLMREWVTTHAPESIAAITGKALASASQHGQKFKFSESAELAIEYNTVAGNDDVLCAFLHNSYSPADREQSRILAAKISDPKRREEILKNLE